MVLLSTAIAENSIKLRWREPYVTEGVDTAMLAHPPGVYRGFWIDQDSPVATQAFRLLTGAPIYMGSDPGHVAGVDKDHFAMYADPTSGFELAIRESAILTIDLAGIGGLWPNAADVDLWISIDVNYAPNVATTAFYIVDNADPRILDPNAIVIGVIHLPAGSMTIDFTGTSQIFYQVISGGDRSWAGPTARESIDDFVPGDRPLGLFTGEDKWLLPTHDEKHALDGAATPATAVNPYVTEADTTDKVWGEPTVATVTVGAALNYVDMAFAAYGAVYLGKGGVGTAQRYLDVRAVGAQGTWNWIAATRDARRITITNICQAGGAVVINPAVATDAEGFYSGGIRVYFSVTYDAANPVTCDIWYDRKRTGATLLQAPALALPNAFVEKPGHADTTGSQRSWSPPGAPLNTDATVTTALANLRAKTRGPHGLLLSESELAMKLFSPTDTKAQLYGAGSELYLQLESAQYPRCMCYGYNDFGAVPAESLLGGERFILYTETNGTRDMLFRCNIQDGETSLTGAYIDPVTDVHNAFIATPCPGGRDDWRIVALASDGRYVYVRLFENTSAVKDRHVLACYDIVNRTQRWAPVLIDDSRTGVYDITPASIIRHNSMHVCVVNSTKVAVNLSWEELVAYHGAGDHDHGIAFYNSATGVWIENGFGNAVEAGEWLSGDAYAAGPMCSDGTNVYFTVRARGAGGPPPDDSNHYGVAQCKIAAPTTWQAGAIMYEIDLILWNPDETLYYQDPQSLVYDGALVWLTTRYAITGWRPIPAANDLTAFVFSNASKYIFGPMVFDGRFLYFGISDVDASLHSTLLYHVVRFNPASLITGSATGLMGDWATLLNRADYFCCDPPKDYSGGVTHIDWLTEVPFGNMVYDGDTIWFTKAWWQSATPMTGRCLTLQRLANVRGI